MYDQTHFQTEWNHQSFKACSKVEPHVSNGGLQSWGVHIGWFTSNQNSYLPNILVHLCHISLFILTGLCEEWNQFWSLEPADHHQSHSRNNHWVLEPDWKSGLKLDLVLELELNPDLILQLEPKQEIKPRFLKIKFLREKKVCNGGLTEVNQGLTGQSGQCHPKAGLELGMISRTETQIRAPS